MPLKPKPPATSRSTAETSRTGDVELVLPSWNAIGRDYPGLEIDTGDGFAPADGEFRLVSGNKLRGAPELLASMLEQGFVKEV